MSVSTNPNSFADRTVVITGASAGVGRAIAHRFAKAGARLGLVARDRGALEQVKTEVERMGARASLAALDVADPQAVQAAADQFVRELGPIDVWINDAMLTVFAPVVEITPEEFRRVTDVTYLGFVHGTMAALRHMRPRGRGHIIQIGSALAYRGIPLQAAYCGAKHAIRGFTDSLRCELLHERSRIELTMLELPAVNTPQFDWARTRLPNKPRPVPPVVQPDVIAEAAFRAAVSPRREYWIGLSTLAVIVANMLVPGWLDGYLARNAYSGQQTSEPLPPGRRDNLMHTVHDLHRTRGSFGREAGRSAIIAPGPEARLLVVAAGAATFLGLGMLLGGMTRRRRPW